MTFGFASGADAAAHVFVDDVDGDEALWVDGDDGHHLQRVRRLRVGERVTASDGRGSWRTYAIAEAGDGRMRLTPTGPLVVEPALTPRLVIAFAPAKRDQSGAVVQQLVELGVDGVMPITLRRSVVRKDGERGERALTRLRTVVREAAMQSRRARVPEVLPARAIEELARHPGVLVASATGNSAGRLAAPVGGEWLVVVGPEGGFDPAEVELLAPYAQVAVGPHVLRAVTAPAAVAAALAGFRSVAWPDSPDSSRIGRST